jgi:hypothetical protein
VIAMVAGGVPESGGPGLAGECRLFVLGLLLRDQTHDRAGRIAGAAPVSLVDYRRAVCALVAVEPLPVLEPGRWVSAGEGRAYRAGQQVWRASMLGAVAAVWRKAVERQAREGEVSRRGLARLSAWTAQIAAVASDGECVRVVLTWDVACDGETGGVSPLLVGDYRVALSVVMQMEPKPLATAGRFVSDTEKAAFEAGARAAYDRAAVVVGRTWQPADGPERVVGVAGDGGIVIGVGAGWHRCAGLCGGAVSRGPVT